MKHFLYVNLFLISLLILSTTMAVLAEEMEIITGIELEGNNLVSSEEILPLIKTKVGDFLDQEKLKADLKAIYDLGYFQDVRIFFEIYQGGLKVKFELIENPIIKDIVIKGNEVFDRPTLLNWLGIKIGEILNNNQIESLKNIERKYQEEGYALARLIDANISKDGILTIEINEGYLNEVVIKGNEKTKDFVILRELNLSKGQVLNIKDIQQGYQNLIRLNYFTNIDPQLERVKNEPNKVNLVVDLTEAKTGNLQLGGGYSSKDGWFGLVDIKERNLLGNGQSLGFKWQFGETTNYSLNFYEPWLRGKPTSFGISLYDKTSESSNSIKGDYTEKKQGGSISLGHALTEDWNGKIRFKIEDFETNWKNESYTVDGVEHDLIDQNDSGSTRSLTLQVNRDTSNHPFNPTKGGINIISLEYAGQILGGDYNFTKYDFELRHYYPGFKDKHAWALRLKTGFGDGNIPEIEKYRLGGSENLRGYERGSFSGDDLLLAQLEYRFPIADKFTGVLFADGGNTWDSIEDIDLSELNYALGAGVRMNTPIGQIRLDYGFNQDGEGMPHFSIGQTF